MSSERQPHRNIDASIFSPEVYLKMTEIRDELRANPYISSERAEILSSELGDTYDPSGLLYNNEAVVIGLGYRATISGDFETHDDREVYGMLDLSDAIFNGFPIQSLPGEITNEIFVEFVDISTDTDTDDKTYYMIPEDIFSLVVEQVGQPMEIDSENLKIRLLGFASRAQDTVSSEEFCDASAERQYEILSEVCHESTKYIASLYLGDIVSIHTDTYYIFNVVDGMLKWQKIDRQTTGVKHEVTGNIQGSAFIETLCSDASAGYEKITDLIERQPGIVLVDEDNIPLYLIPFRNFNSLRINQEKQIE